MQDFYKNLPAIKHTIPAVLANENYFVDLPESWHIVVADITNSTGAVATGRHGDINLIAAGCLIAALNVTKELKVEIPYFFGGDGGTVLVPEQILNKVIAGLNAHRINTNKNFSLELRVGSISIADIKKAGQQIRLAKVEESSGFNKPVLIGNGLKYAERIIKSRYRVDEVSQSFIADDLNLEGMQCKWDKIKPPASGLEVVCFLIDSMDEKKQPDVYSAVLNKLDEIYGGGGMEKRHPLTINMLKLKSSFKKIHREMIVRYSKWKPVYMLNTLLQTIAGRLYFKFNLKVNNLKGHEYLSQLIAFSEILTIDGRINTIVSGTAENRRQFLEYLQQQESKKLLVYGHYVSAASIMTCYIENMNNKHIHFVDGSDGGYTEAAKELKPKAAQLLMAGI